VLRNQPDPGISFFAIKKSLRKSDANDLILTPSFFCFDAAANYRILTPPLRRIFDLENPPVLRKKQGVKIQ
jgi:hypothetical protein